MTSNGTPHRRARRSSKWQQWRANDPGDPCEYTTEAARLISVFEGEGDDEQEVCALILSFPLAAAITNALCAGRQRSNTVSQSDEKRKDIESRRIDEMGQLKSANMLLKRYEKKLENVEGKMTEREQEDMTMLFRKQYQAKTELKKLDREEKKAKKRVKKSNEAWYEGWKKVDGMLEGVWIDAKLLDRPAGNKKGSDKDKDEDGREQGMQEDAKQEHVADPRNSAVSPISQISEFIPTSPMQYAYNEPSYEPQQPENNTYGTILS